jgi:hypothetical protein
VLFIPDQNFDAVFFAKSIDKSLFVLPDALDQIRRDANIQSSLAPIRQNVNAGLFHEVIISCPDILGALGKTSPLFFLSLLWHRKSSAAVSFPRHSCGSRNPERPVGHQTPFWMPACASMTKWEEFPPLTLPSTPSPSAIIPSTPGVQRVVLHAPSFLCRRESGTVRHFPSSDGT